MKDKSAKIAVIGNGNIYERKGLTNAIINRVKYLIEIAPFQIDPYIIGLYKPWYISNSRTSHNTEKGKNVDGIEFRLIWRRFSIIDYLFKIRLHKRTILQSFFNKRISKLFAQYDLINCHSFESGLIAIEIWRKYHIPYVVTWHGSDIHTSPFQNKWIKEQTIKIIENAACNFFVSKKLLEQSQKITSEGHKELLYNGVGEDFYQYTDDERSLIKKELGLNDDNKIVMFCGGFFSVKNVLSLPKIFKHIHKEMPNVVFWMIGDGKYRTTLEEGMKDLPVHFWGNQPHEDIPKFMNVANVLILPSFNEGLPLVSIEALSCGCYVVGSDRGGIPEAIGKENCISLDTSNFPADMARKILSYLNIEERAMLSPETQFNWRKTAQKENEIICKILNGN